MRTMLRWSFHSLFLMPFAANAEGQREAVATVFDSTARNNHENAY
jgi:hypothetical protein